MTWHSSHQSLFHLAICSVCSNYCTSWFCSLM